MGYTFAENTGTEFEKALVKDRVYPAVFKSYRVYQKPNPNTGEQEDRLAWTFEVSTKKGIVELAGFTSVKFGISKQGTIAKARKWVAAMLGIKATDNVPRDLDAVLGKRCEVKTITIEKNGVESSVIDDVMPPDDDDEDDEDDLPAKKEENIEEIPF